MTSPHSDIPPQASEDAPHKPADDTEEVYFKGAPLLRGETGRMFGFSLAALICVVAPFLYRVFSKSGEWPVWWLTLGLILLGIVIELIPIAKLKSNKYRISNYRIDCERGLFSKNIDTMELWHVEDISFHQSLLDRILGVGTIIVMSHDDTNPRLELKSLPNPRPLFDQLKQRIIAVKRQRGVVKMDIGT